MTVDQLIEQCVARGLAWQLQGSIGPNRIPFVTATVYAPDTRPPTMAMQTRSGLPVPAAVALEQALAEVVGRLEVRRGS